MGRGKRGGHQVGLFFLGIVLGTAIFFSYSCYPQQRPQKQRPQPTPVAPAAASTAPTNLQTTYRAVLQGDTGEKRREIFRLGYHFLQEKNRSGAQLFLSRALEVYPPLADYSLYFLGVLHREEGHPDQARAFFLRLLEQYSQSIWVNQAALELASLALANKDWATATYYAQDARNGQNVRKSTKHAADLILAQAHEEQGEINAAYEQYQELRGATPNSRVGRVAKKHVERLRALDSDHFGLHSEQDYLAEMRLRAKEGDATGLEVLVARFSANFPGSSQHAEVLALLASTYKNQRRTADAIRTWRDIADRYPNTSAGSAALYRAATLLWNSDHDDEALALFKQLTQQTP